MKIYISNLSFQAVDGDIQTLFSKFGEVESAIVILDNFTRRSRGFALVEMKERLAGEDAVQKLNNTSFMHKTIAVREATKR